MAEINKCSAVAEMGDRLATTDMSGKFGGYTSVPSGILIHPINITENWGSWLYI